MKIIDIGMVIGHENILGIELVIEKLSNSMNMNYADNIRMNNIYFLNL